MTDAPQVATHADHNYLIAKNTLDKRKRVANSVSEAATANRREKIAPVLAGAEVTEQARAAAERVIRAAVG